MSEVRTETTRLTHGAEPWNIAIDSLCPEMEAVWSEDVAFSLPSSGQPAVFDAEAFHPELAAAILAHARAAITSALARGSVSEGRAETARAIRLQVRGCYVHQVGYRLDGGKHESQLYIGGIHNRVAPGALYSLCKTSTAWAQRPLHWLMRSIGVVATDGPTTTFRNRLRKKGGTIHMRDTRARVAEAIESRKFGLTVLDEGYEVTLDGTRIAVIELTHGEASGDSIVSLVCPLGEAIRDRFVDALQLNSGMVFGRVALVVEPHSGALGFTLFDIRPYAEVDALTYGVILDYLLNTVRPHAASKLVSS
ncbi:MAG: hypothetical protein ACKOXX_04105 [Actinomycetota bacterium]